jgi:hypothetical protein
VSFQRVIDLAGRQFNRVSREQVAGLGFTPDAIAHRIATRQLIIVREGVFALPPVLDYDDRARWMEATLTSPDTFLHRDAAARAYGVLSFGSRLVVVRPGSGGPRWIDGIRVHRSSTLEGETTEYQGIPITTMPRTLVDLACCASKQALAKALRDSIRLGQTTIYELGDYIGTRMHRRGARKVVSTMSRYRGLPLERARSGAEIRALEILREAGCPLPLLNEDVAGEEADLSWGAAKLIIEIDGGPFHLDVGNDARKEHAWRSAGWEVRRIPSDDVYERPGRLLALVQDVPR